MEVLKPPAPMNFKAQNCADAWDKWETRWCNYFKAAELGKKDRDVQVAILLEVAGPDALTIHKTFKFDPPEVVMRDGHEVIVHPGEDPLDWKVILNKFGKYCKPRKNVVFERYMFWTRDQEDGESLDQWIIVLRTQAASCEFGEQEDLLLRDKVVFGIRDQRAKERMLREGDLTLQKALDICHAAESTQRQLEGMKGAVKQVNAIQKGRYAGKSNPKYKKGQAKGQQAKANTTQAGQPAKKQQLKNCYYCGSTHHPKKCPAYGATCGKCGYRNHFDAVCQQVQGARRKALQIVEADDESDEYLVISTIFIGSVTEDSRWHETIQVGDTHVEFKLDTGAEANVLPLQTLQKAMPKALKLQSTKVTLTAFGESKVKPLGTAIVPCSHNGDTWRVKFFVTEAPSLPILGQNACDKMGLVKRIYSLDKMDTGLPPLTKEELTTTYADVFKGLGEYEQEYHIETKPDVEPVVQYPRRVPYPKKAKLKQTLEHLEKQGVVAKVDKATDWVVITEKKDGRMRICLDPRPLNKAIKRERYQMPTPADVQGQLTGKRIFTVIDMKDGFWHVRLSDQSSYLTTFSTPWGRMRFRRMPFGILSASEVMQKRNEEAFGDIPGVHVIADDLIVAAHNEAEHDHILRQVMQRAKEKNVKFNATKIQFKVASVLYMGNRVTAEGLKPDEAKVKAIQEMPQPDDRPALQRFLGMVKYLAQYIPDESTITAPLRQLLKKDVPWQWEAEHAAALDTIKASLAKQPVLRYYDVEKPVTIQADASQSGLGACLLQEEQPVHYASRSLTDAETRYSQIEKEMLAICFAVKKFHQYIYGKPVDVQSDHRPLEQIFRKPLAKSSPRLQRMQLSLQHYDLNVRYVPGKLMYMADTLSRAYLSDDEHDPEAEEDLDVLIHALVKDMPVSEPKKDKLREATEQDPDLQLVKQMVLRGWPRHRRSTPKSIQGYWLVRDQIHIAEDLLCMDDRIIVPKLLQQEMLTTLHESHMGAEKTKSRARQALYWPSMADDIDKKVAECATCLRYRSSQQKEPLMPHQVPDRPWQKLGADFLTCRGQDYLLVVDYYSKYPELIEVQDKTAANLIMILKEMFGRHGYPDTLMSDNVPFNCREFKQYADDYGFQLITSSPTYPQSNGQSERHVQIVKRMLKKAGDEGTDVHLALLEYRNTPLTGTSFSPAQMLMGRALRSKLPVTNKHLKPAQVEPYPQLVRLKQRQKRYYDRAAKPLAPLHPGDTVRVRNQRTWEPAVVTRKDHSPRSYWVDSGANTELRRNRRHLLRTGEKPPDFPIEEPDLDNIANLPANQAANMHMPVATRSEHQQPAEPPPTPRSPPQMMPRSTAVINTQPASRRTRSGRVVKTPQRFRDYA